MANGHTVNEIKSLLQEDGAIKTSTALRLMLDLQLQQYEEIEKLTGVVESNRRGVESWNKWHEEHERNKKTWVTPLVNAVVTIGVTTVVNAIIFYSTYRVAFERFVENTK